MNGSIQTADESSSLNIAGYGMVFLRHEVIIKGKKHTVTSKISPVYYAPGMAYQLFSVGSLLQKGYFLNREKKKMTIRKPDSTKVDDSHLSPTSRVITFCDFLIQIRRSCLGETLELILCNIKAIIVKSSLIKLL